MQLVTQIAELRKLTSAWRGAQETVALVPTLGNLHRGHGALVTAARERAQRVVVSIFVNPTQFGPQEDFENYPRTLDDDCRLVETLGADAVFAPPLAEMYPPSALTTVHVASPLTDQLCGVHRPSHFGGVALVVTKLFNLVLPQIALFGEKDWQQLLVIRQLTADLNFPIEIIGLPTIRESDGLALSSRNRYLTADQRALAPLLYRTLCDAATAWQQGMQREQIEGEAIATLSLNGFHPEYVAIRRAHDLGIPTQRSGNRIFAAARLDAARLIDNLGLE